MLCPKCGFISFDHLSVCGKCHNDLSGIGAELHGTAADVEGRYFLGTLFKEGTAPQPGFGEEVAVASSVGVPLTTGIAVPSGEGTLEIDVEESVQEEGGALFSGEESPALEFDLDEIPHLGSEAPDRSVGSEMPEEERVQPSEEEPSLLTSEPAKVGEPAPLPVEETSEAGGPELELDISGLTLDSGMEEAPASGEEVEPTEAEDHSAPLTIDLKSIDLSDLVHHEEGAASAQQGAGEAGEGGLNMEDTMDLSLFSGEAQLAPPAEAGPTSAADDLSPIDLTLVEEALEELTLDPSRKVEPPAAKGGQDILGLSMEESDK